MNNIYGVDTANTGGASGLTQAELQAVMDSVIKEIQALSNNDTKSVTKEVAMRLFSNYDFINNPAANPWTIAEQAITRASALASVFKEKKLIE